MSQWLNLEHRIYENLLEQKLKGSSLLVALSGGADSLCLTHVLHRLQSALSLKLTIAHIHHGSGETPEQNLYRKRAQAFCASLAEDLSLPFFQTLYSGPQPLKGEASLRDFRYQSLYKILRAQGYDYLALGHHGGDLLETRLMHLLRGTGVKGLLALSFLEGQKLRPLLPFSKSDIHHYLKTRKLVWLEDPQNQDPHLLRVWLRSRLQELEAFRPGALKTLSRSFRMLEASLQTSHEWPRALMDAMEWEEKGLSRSIYASLSKRGQHTLIATYMSRLLHKKNPNFGVQMKIEADTEMETEMETERGIEIGRETQMETETEAKIEMETGMEMETETDTEMETERGIERAVEVKKEMKRGKIGQGFSQQQVAEVVKRLRRPQKEFSFRLAGQLWQVSAKHILARFP